MNDKAKEAIKRAAWLQLAGPEIGQAVSPYYSEGFDAGYKAAQRWTRIEDALPTETDYYLTYNRFGGPFRDEQQVRFFVVGNGWFRDSDCDDFTDISPNIVAWMPLPEPLEENE